MPNAQRALGHAGVGALGRGRGGDGGVEAGGVVLEAVVA